MKKRTSSGAWPASRWRSLFRQATALLDGTGIKPYWTFGGGTALALRYQHRLSYDVDIFLRDAQVLAFLSPRTSDLAASLAQTYQESANGVNTSDGDIDFLVTGEVTGVKPEAVSLEGQETLVDAPAEILAKKLQFRGAYFTERDIFDLAVLMAADPSQVATAIEACSAEALNATAQAIARRLPHLRSELPDYINPTAEYAPFIAQVPAIVSRFPGVDGALEPKRRSPSP